MIPHVSDINKLC